MHFTSYLQDRQLTVALTGEIDHHCAKEYMQHISEKIESYTPSVCVLDFQEVTFMDSSGIAVVIHALRQMAQLGGRLQLQSIAEQPMKVLRAAPATRPLPGLRWPALRPSWTQPWRSWGTLRQRCLRR